MEFNGNCILESNCPSQNIKQSEIRKCYSEIDKCENELKLMSNCSTCLSGYVLI